MGLEHLDPKAPLSSISIAMQQLVAIARAMVIDAKVLILDEPTSSLDANEVQDLFKIMRKIRDSASPSSSSPTSLIRSMRLPTD